MCPWANGHSEPFSVYETEPRRAPPEAAMGSKEMEWLGQGVATVSAEPRWIGWMERREGGAQSWSLIPDRRLKWAC